MRDDVWGGARHNLSRDRLRQRWCVSEEESLRSKIRRRSIKRKQYKNDIVELMAEEVTLCGYYSKIIRRSSLYCNILAQTFQTHPLFSNIVLCFCKCLNSMPDVSFFHISFPRLTEKPKPLQHLENRETTAERRVEISECQFIVSQ